MFGSRRFSSFTCLMVLQQLVFPLKVRGAVRKGVVVDSSSSSSGRFLQNDPDEDVQCSSGFSAERAFYNVLFNLTTVLPTECTEAELYDVGVVLEEEFDRVLASVPQGVLHNHIEAMSSQTDVCHHDDETENRSRHRSRHLQVGFNVYLYRSDGRCYFCSDDDWDGTRRGLSPQEDGHEDDDSETGLTERNSRTLQNDSLDSNWHFGQIIASLQGALDMKLTTELRLRFNGVGSTHCLRGVGAMVESTIVVKTEALQDAICEDVCCCAHSGIPDTCYSDIGGTDVALNFCHSTKDRCENLCGGNWINPFTIAEDEDDASDSPTTPNPTRKPTMSPLLRPRLLPTVQPTST